jgi:aerobic carbon-monoxide dehydrogenase medium subunit
MQSFSYHRPKAVSEAAKLLTSSDDALPLAGGHTLLPAMKQRLRAPSDLVDLSAIADLVGISRSGATLTIGAMTRHVAVQNSTEVASAIPALAHLAGLIGDPQVRNRGTIGGSLANNDPAADYPAAVLGLGATLVTNQREIAADDFFLGMFETALQPGELLTAVRFPVPQAAGYAKFPNPVSRYAMVGVMVAQTGGGIRVAVTGAGPCVFRWAEAEAALAGSFTPEALEGLAGDADALNSDLHGSAAYRAHLMGVMAKRAVGAALNR